MPHSLPSDGSGVPARLARALVLFAFPLLLAGCEDRVPTSQDETTIPEEQFVSAMVGLREAIIRSPRGSLSQAERDRVLAEHGVTPDDLTRFAEVHGRNVPMMNQVWTEVERRIAEIFGVPLMTEEEMIEGLPTEAEVLEGLDPEF